MIPKGFKLLDHLNEEQKAQYLAEKEAKKLEQAGAQKVFRRFNKLIKEHGYTRRSNWFSKESGQVIHSIHFHKYSFGPTFRMHVFIRALNDSEGHVALNGMSDRKLHLYNKKFEYQNSEESILTCAYIMYEAFKDVALLWFEANTLEVLLSEASPLTKSGREGLMLHLKDQENQEYINRSRKLLGINA